MKLAVAQFRPIKGDIKKNIKNHKPLIDLAVQHGAEMIFFPELSLTGYEPELAAELAATPYDSIFTIFKQISDEKKITIGVGTPLKNSNGVRIGMIIFQPNADRSTYLKHFLHTDELPFFVPGENMSGTPVKNKNIAIAICYELFVPEHSLKAHKNGATIYIASVAKTAEGIEKASTHLAAIATSYSMTVLMSNCVGYCDNFESGGKTSIWNNKGALLGQLDDKSQGILMINTDTNEIIETIL